MTEESTATPAAEVDKFPCPNCSKKVVYDPERAGRELSCPHCWEKFQMPATELGLLIQIRDNTADTAYWAQWIFWLLAIPVILTVFLYGVGLMAMAFTP